MLATSWLIASEVKELIPQLFYLPELFVNKEGFILGRRQNREEVSDVEMLSLPPLGSSDYWIYK